MRPREIQDEYLSVLNINFKLRFRFQGFSSSFKLVFELNLQFNFEFRVSTLGFTFNVLLPI